MLVYFKFSTQPLFQAFRTLKVLSRSTSKTFALVFNVNIMISITVSQAYRLYHHLFSKVTQVCISTVRGCRDRQSCGRYTPSSTGILAIQKS